VTPAEKVQARHQTPKVITAKPIREYRREIDDGNLDQNVAYNPWDNFERNNRMSDKKEEVDDLQGAPLSHTEIRRVKQKSSVRLGGAPESEASD
jgi:hypothetical protein